jgi:hypothetical protein
VRGSESERRQGGPPITTQEQWEEDRLAEIENWKVYERLLAEMRAADPEECERYLEAVRLTDPRNPYDRELDELLDDLRSAPVHPARGNARRDAELLLLKHNPL